MGYELLGNDIFHGKELIAKLIAHARWESSWIVEKLFNIKKGDVFAS